MPRYSKSREANADFVGPLRLLVGAGLAYMLWLTVKASSPSEAPAMSSETASPLDLG